MRKSLLICWLILLACAGFTVQAHAQAPPKPRDTTIQGPQTFAMIMGISKYKYVRPLNFADKDAEMMRDFFKSPAGGKLSDDNIYMLLNEQATLAGFYTQGFKWLKAKNLQKGDRLFIYLAGHGDAIDEDQFFYLAYDCNPAGDKNNYLVSGAIRMYDVKVKIQREAAKGVDVFLVMDACRTNELPGGSEGQSQFNSAISEKRAGEIIMLATGAGQESLEDAKIGHGLFTWYLVDGLNGIADSEGNADRTVTVEEIQKYVQKNVPTVAQEKFKRKQEPFFCCTENSSKIVSQVDEAYLKKWLEDRKKSRGGNSAAESRGVSFTPSDTAVIRYYNLFNAAVKESRLTGKNSADFYCSFMEKNFPGSPYTEDAMSNLAVEFINFASSKINLYLDCKDASSIQKLRAQVDEDEKTDEVDASLARMEKVARQEFYEVGYMLERAIGFIQGDDPEFARSLLGRMYFFKARGYFGSGKRQVDIKKAFEYAYAAQSSEKNAAYVMQTLATLHLDLLRLDSAIYYARRAIQIAPRWRYPYVTMAFCYKTLNRPDSAIRYYRQSIELNPEYADAWVDLGHYYYSLSLADSAIVNYEKALALEPGNVYASNNIGWLYHDRKQFAQAIQYFKRTIDADPRFLNAYNGLSKTYFETGQFDSARIYYSKAFVNYQDKSIVNVYIGNFYRDLKQYDSAKVYYWQAVELDPTYEEAFNHLGRASQALKQYDSANHYFRRALEANPYSAQALINIGQVYRELKMADSTYYYYQQAIFMEPGSPALLNNLGVIYIQDKMIDSAKYYFRRALRLKPDYRPASNNLIRIFRENNQLDSVTLLLKTFTPLQPGSTAFLNEMGKIFYDQKRFDSARVYFRQALQKDPSNPQVLNNMGLVLQALRRTDSARWYMQRAIQQDPKNPLYAANLSTLFKQLKQLDSAALYFRRQLFLRSGETPQAYFSVGTFLYETRQYDSALYYFRRAIQLNPRYALAYSNSASAFIQLEQYDSAMVYARTAVGLDPESRTALLDLGLSYHALGRYDSAIVYLQRTTEVDTADGQLWFRLACSYALNRQPAEAVRSLRSACEKGYISKDEMLNDPDLAGLRGRADYEALLDRYVPGWRGK